jgi:hypothetical protein
MKLNELISNFTIYVNNEEDKLLQSINYPTPIDSFDERDRVVIESLARKSLISKVRRDNVIFVVKNEE